MRFTIGQAELFISIKLEYPNGNKNSYGFFHMYRPWEDKLLDMKIYKLHIIEHHRVAGNWDDIIQYDGFIMKDEQGKTWHNQYPRAAYGQTSDEADRMVTLQRESDTQLNPDVMYRGTLLSSHMEIVYQGYYDLSKKSETKEQAVSLKHYYDGLVKTIEDQFGAKVELGHPQFGDTILDEHFQVKIILPETVIN